MHLAPLIVDLAIILAVAGIMSFVFQKIRQPVVLGYILAGVIVGPYTPGIFVIDIPTVNTMAELGVIFLMFTLGLEFSFRKLLSVGLTAVLSATCEVLFFLITGYAIGQWLGWSSMDSIFLGAMLSVSSTTIIIKALEELKLNNHRFASLIFGVLIVEDLIAILLLVGLTTIATSHSFSVVSLAAAGINLVIIVSGWFITGYFIVPRIISYIGKNGNNEMLTLVSVALCLLLVVLASHLGYSTALGAFIMGSILAETEILNRIEQLTAPIRDLFGAIFFVSIGMLLDPKIMWQYKEIIFLLCIFTIIGKIISTSTGSLLSGQSFKNSMQVGLGLAQIGEFSFIIASLGVSLKATSNKIYPIGVAVSLVTTFTTPYLIKYSASIAETLQKKLPRDLRNSLERYRVWNEYHKAGPQKNRSLMLLIFRWLANGILVTLVFKIIQYLPIAKFLFNNDKLAKWSQFFSWFLSLIISSPFIWAMLFTSKKNYLKIRKDRNLLKGLVVLAFPIFSIIWIGILSTTYFPLKYILSITTLIIIIIYILLYRKLESYYKWMERTFLETFQNKENDLASSHIIEDLAPWDFHLIKIEVHPNATLVNQTLKKAQLRNKYGINIVVIQRGMQTIVSPKPDEVILPRDSLIILGTDEQLDLARPELEIPTHTSINFPANNQYRLRHFKLKKASSLTGQTIRDSKIREDFHAMVVGIERDNIRIINPDTDLEIQENDVLWVVGEHGMLEKLLKEVS